MDSIMSTDYSDQDTPNISFITFPPDHGESILIKNIPIDTTREQRYIYTFIDDSPTAIFTNICELLSLLTILRPTYIDSINHKLRCLIGDRLTEFNMMITLAPFQEITGYTLQYGRRIYIIQFTFAGGDYHEYAKVCDYIEALLTTTFHIYKL
jgi:hypothetical protein